MSKKDDKVFRIMKIIAIIFGVLCGIAIILLIVSNNFNYTISLPMLTVAKICIGVGGGGLILEFIAYIVYCRNSPTLIAERKKNEEEIRAREEKKRELEDWKLHHITKTTIVHTATKKDNANTMTRGVVGGWLFGTAGAVVGTATGKENEFTTFLFIYSDGSREAKEVQNGSAEYNLYIQHLEV